MIRHLIPRFACGHWGGPTPSDPYGCNEEATGRFFAVQWFGLMLDVSVGRISRAGGK